MTFKVSGSSFINYKSTFNGRKNRQPNQPQQTTVPIKTDATVYVNFKRLLCEQN